MPKKSDKLFSLDEEISVAVPVTFSFASRPETSVRVVKVSITVEDLASLIYAQLDAALPLPMPSRKPEPHVEEMAARVVRALERGSPNPLDADELRVWRRNADRAGLLFEEACKVARDIWGSECAGRRFGAALIGVANEAALKYLQKFRRGVPAGDVAIDFDEEIRVFREQIVEQDNKHNADNRCATAAAVVGRRLEANLELLGEYESMDGSSEDRHIALKKKLEGSKGSEKRTVSLESIKKQLSAGRAQRKAQRKLPKLF